MSQQHEDKDAGIMDEAEQSPILTNPPRANTCPHPAPTALGLDRTDTDKHTSNSTAVLLSPLPVLCRQMEAQFQLLPPTWRMSGLTSHHPSELLRTTAAQEEKVGHTHTQKRGQVLQGSSVLLHASPGKRARNMTKSRGLGAGFSCSGSNEFLKEGLQLILILYPHKLIHNISVLHSQHSRHS